MTYQFKPDFEQSQKRIEAFWDRQLIDRPVVQFFLDKPLSAQIPFPADHHATPRERWLDVQYQAERARASLANQYFLGDSLPIAWPNLGPEIFSSFYGCPLHFGDYGTSWTDPILFDWSQADALTLDWDNLYMRTLIEMTDAFLDLARDHFIVGMTDWHPGGDALAAFRDPQNLAMDLITHPSQVKTLLQRVEADYLTVYDYFYHKLHAAGQPCTSWLSLLSSGKFYIPSNDFSIMISSAMFEEFFLPGLTREIRFLDRSIYHLDGIGALRHLDSILAIPELNALQFVPGEGHNDFSQWIPVYQKIQAAGKGIWVAIYLDELQEVIDALDPHGLFLFIRDVDLPESAHNVLRALERMATSNSRN